MADLNPNDFAAFFEAVHGHAPFPWQARLSRSVAANGRWPGLLDLPTGTGKTAALDVALFHLALESGRADRAAPLRILFVVDRRTIVDQAFRRARRIQRALAEDSPPSQVLRAVKARLLAYSSSGVPLEVALLRGGIPRSDRWADSPDQPLIAVSTVDQVGSRLLFRGYGVSDRMKPVHAGLLGNDVLWLLDEVHLSEPFRQTLTAIETRWRHWCTRPDIPQRFSVVEMSATPGRNRLGFGLEQDDRENPILLRRLVARKPTRVVADVKSAAFEGLCAKEAKALLSAGRAVAVVVNRVATARSVATALLNGAGDGYDVRLLTGRMRPLEREALEVELRPRIAAGERTRDAKERPVIVVATQSIEAGADLDFDGLVTECASLDALRQRFGRLDRLGALGQSTGVVLGRAGDLSGDPVYGDAIGHTLSWLKEREDIDFGPSHLALPVEGEIERLLAPRPQAPLLLPAHLDAWVQTAPIPYPDPDVALWLHGPDSGPADVQIVWRADVEEAALEAAGPSSEARLDALLATVQAVPPAPGEALAVPYVAARRWLSGLPEPPIADVEGAPEPGDSDRLEPIRSPRRALVWRGDDSRAVPADDIRPGDTLVVPAAYGGIDQANWAPGSDERVRDIGDRAAFRQRGRAVLRLHPEVLRAAGYEALAGLPAPGEETEDREIVWDWLAEVAQNENAPAALRATARRLLDEGVRRLRVFRVPCWRVDSAGQGSVVEHYVVSGRKRWTEVLGEVAAEETSGSFTGVEVTLRDHVAGVTARVGDFARRLGVSETLASDLRLAAAWHDTGKLDPRFQRLLHGGSAYQAMVAAEPLAKSGMAPTDRRARQRARELSGYPAGARHELMSVALMSAGAERLAQGASDWDLVLHLVASHHGYCRPFPPAVADPQPIDVKTDFEPSNVSASSDHGLARLDSGIVERFWRLVGVYGWWQLAWLESLLRLADQRQSAREQEPGHAT